MNKEERWKDVVSYEGLYEVSNFGRIKSKNRVVKVRGNGGVYRELKGKFLKPCETIGYKKVVLCKDGKRKSVNVHRLVAESFIPNPLNLPMVNHKDETRNNDHFENLEWCSHQYNITYGTVLKRKAKALAKKVQGTHVETGEKIYFSSTAEAGRNGFTQSLVCACCNNKAEKHKNYIWKYIQKN